jgi:hypothetical protein
MGGSPEVVRKIQQKQRVMFLRSPLFFERFNEGSTHFWLN